MFKLPFACETSIFDPTGTYCARIRTGVFFGRAHMCISAINPMRNLQVILVSTNYKNLEPDYSKTMKTDQKNNCFCFFLGSGIHQKESRRDNTVLNRHPVRMFILLQENGNQGCVQKIKKMSSIRF